MLEHIPKPCFIHPTENEKYLFEFCLELRQRIYELERTRLKYRLLNAYFKIRGLWIRYVSQRSQD